MSRKWLPKMDGEMVLSGLLAFAEVIRDCWRGSQIYAETEPQLFYSQGRLLLIVAASTADEKPERELHERSPKPNR